MFPKKITAKQLNVPAVTYQLVHGATDHVLGHDDRAGHGEDGALFAFRIILTSHDV